MELGYLYEKLHIKFTNEEQEESEYLPRFNQFESKVNAKFSSNLKSDNGKSSNVQTPVSHMKAFNFGESQMKSEKISDSQLSKKYENLKLKQEKLLR